MIIAVNFPIYAIGKKKPEKNQGFNGIRTRDLRDTGVMLYQLSYEATHCTIRTWRKETISKKNIRKLYINGKINTDRSNILKEL